MPDKEKKILLAEDDSHIEAKLSVGRDEVKPSSSRNTNKNSKFKILLAEDDKFISCAYKDGLERAGFEVVLAYNGVEAIEKVKKEKPSLILLDIVMPDKNGFEVLEEIKMDTELEKIPVLIMSNLGQDSDIAKGKALGAVDYLVKTNFSMKKVIERVKFCLVKAK